MNTFWLLRGGGPFFGQWQVVVDIFWLVVGGGGWQWVVVDILWLVVGGGGWWWVVFALKIQITTDNSFQKCISEILEKCF